MRSRDFGVLHSRVFEVSISLAARPAPSCRHRILKGRSVTPAMGASTATEGSSYDPMRIVPGTSDSAAVCARGSCGCEACISARAGVVGAGDRAPGLREAGIDLESDGVRAGIDEGHFRVDALP